VFKGLNNKDNMNKRKEEKSNFSNYISTSKSLFTVAYTIRSEDMLGKVKITVEDFEITKTIAYKTPKEKPSNLNLRPVVNVVCFLPGNPPASEFCMPILFFVHTCL
jgi:hypothetical protein